jgi:predicted O-methyltransferase YrrM
MNKIESQLHPGEKELLKRTLAAFDAPKILEIGTYKGGGSTLTFLQVLKNKGRGKLFGVEAAESVFKEMKANISSVVPDYAELFEPIHGYSQVVIPSLLRRINRFDLAFLDGGNNPREQIEEFALLKDAIPVGGFIFSHDANLRKGRWLVPYLMELDNWRTVVHHESEEGMLEAEKLHDHPSAESQSKAQARLRRLMMSPIEVATRFFPSSFKGAVLKLLPCGVRRRIGEGRK